MPEKFIDRSYAGGGSVRNAFGSGNTSGWSNSNNMFDRMQKKTPAQQSSQPVAQKSKPAFSAATTHVPSANFAPDDPAGMEPGMEVEHQKFGFGTIAAIEGAINNRIATIVFPKGGGEKKIMLNYAKLRIVREDKA
jgi:DNA helicase-2/ATP-dependent DNA helicase PcrA